MFYSSPRVKWVIIQTATQSYNLETVTTLKTVHRQFQWKWISESDRIVMWSYSNWSMWMSFPQQRQVTTPRRLRWRCPRQDLVPTPLRWVHIAYCCFLLLLGRIHYADSVTKRFLNGGKLKGGGTYIHLSNRDSCFALLASVWLLNGFRNKYTPAFISPFPFPTNSFYPCFPLSYTVKRNSWKICN